MSAADVIHRCFTEIDFHRLNTFYNDQTMHCTFRWSNSLGFNNMQAKQQNVPAYSKIVPTQIGHVDGLKNTATNNEKYSNILYK